MRALWISLCVTLIIAFVEAQQKNLNLPKPVGSLEKPRPSFWRRSPEERRKLSIFPKNNQKFMITERPIIKKEVTKPAVTTKRPLMKKLVIKDNSKKNTWSYPQREPLITPKQFNAPMTPQPKRDKPRIYKSKNYDEIAEESTIKTVVTSFKTEGPVNNVQLNKGNLIQVLNRDKPNVAPAKNIEPTNKISSKKMNKVIQNNNFAEANSSDKVFKEPAIDVSANSIKENMRPAKIEKQVNEFTERVILSKQVDNMTQNNESSHANSLVTVSAEYDSEETYYDNSEAKMTSANINNETTEKVFLSKQINNVTQNNNILKVNLPDNVSDEHAVDKNDPTPAEIIKYEENESTTHILTEDLLNLNETFEGRSSDSNELELNDQSDHTFLISNSKQSLNVKKGDSSNLNDLEALVEVFAKDFNNYSDQKPSIHPLDRSRPSIDPLVVLIQNINKETVKSQTQQSEKRLNNLYEVKPITDMEEVSKISTDFNLNAAVTEVKGTIESTEIKTNYTNNETNQNQINVDLTNDLQNLMEVIKRNSTSEDNKPADSELLKLDLNIVEEYTNSTDTILSEYNETMPKSESYDILTESPIEVIFDDIKTLNVEEQLEGPSLIGHVNTGNVISTVSEISENIENVSINANSAAASLNIQENNKDNAIIDNLRNLAEVIKEESAVSSNGELAKDERQLVNLDTNIVEEYSDLPKIIAIKLDESTQESYSINEVLTESAINILYNQEAPDTEKITFEPIFEENIYIITDKTVSNELSTTSEIIPTINIPITEFLLKTEDDGNINTISMNDNLNVEKTHSKNNANSTIGIILPNVDEVVTYGSNIGDNGRVTNIVGKYSDKPNTIANKLDENTQESYSLNEVLTESPINIFFYDQEAPGTEKNTFEPIFEENIYIIADKTVSNELSITSEIIPTIDIPVTEFLLKTEDDGNTNTISMNDNLNVEKNHSENNTNSTIGIILPNADEVDNYGSNIGDNGHVTNIVGKYIDKPNTIATKLDENTQESYSLNEVLTESPINIFFYDQEAPGTEKITFEPIFEENIYIIADKTVSNELSITSEIIPTIDIPVTEFLLKTEDTNSNTISPNDNLTVEENHSENNANSTIRVIIPNADEVVNYGSNIGDNDHVTIGKIELLSHHLDIVDEDINNLISITTVTDGTLSTQQAYVEGEYETVAPTKNFLNDLETSSTDPSLDMYTNTMTEEPVADQFNVTEIITEVEKTVKDISQEVKDGNTSTTSKTEFLVNKQNANNNADSPNIVQVIDDYSIVNDTTKVVTSETPALNLHINIIEENQPTTITIVFDGATQNTYLNGKHVDDAPFGILFDNLEPLDPNNEKLNRPISKIPDVLETDSLNSNDEDIQITEKPSYLSNEEISDARLVASSNPSGEEIYMVPINKNSNNIQSEESSNEFKEADEEISIESYVDNVINLNDEIFSIVMNSFSSTSIDEDMSAGMIAEADQSKKTTDEISKESISFNDSSSEIVTQENMSNEMIADQSKNLTDESSRKSSIVFDDSRNTITNEEMSDEIIAEADQSKIITDEISKESIILNDSSSGIVAQENISDEMIAEQSKNLTEEFSRKSSIVFDDSRNTITNKEMSDEISKGSNILNDSSSEIVTQENISDEMIADQSKNLTEKSSRESSIVFDDSRNTITNEEMSDEIIAEADQSKTMTDEISKEPIIFNDSSSEIVTQENISDEMIADQSKNLTEESSRKSSIVFDDSGNTLTNEETSDEIIADTDQSQKKSDGISNESIVFNESSSDIVTQEDISDELIADQSKNLTDESSRKSSIVFDDSRNTITNEEMSDEIIAEADQSTNSNDSDLSNGSFSSATANEEISDEIIADQSKNISNEVSSESTAEVVDLTSGEKSENFTDPKNMTGEDVSNGPAIDIRHPSAELASNEMPINRIKRSNNIIEEENLATTLSGFKYTGHETRLSHDLSFKNINA